MKKFTVEQLNAAGGWAHSTENSPGMTLRDWFAGKALRIAYGQTPTGAPSDEIAARAYLIADAMLAARNAS